MKLPNGFGSIACYSGNRRRPYIVRKYIDGRQKIIGQYATYEDALAFLVDYNKNPSLFAPATITFAEVYRLMAAERYPKIAKSTANNYKAAFKHCHELHGRPFAKLEISDLQDVIRGMSRRNIGYASQKKCRQLMHLMYEYAVKYKIIPAAADITCYIDIDKKVVRYPKKPFITRQLNRVKKLANSDDTLARWAMCIVMMCYSGVRPGEFLAIQKNDVKLKHPLSLPASLSLCCRWPPGYRSSP